MDLLEFAKFSLIRVMLLKELSVGRSLEKKINLAQ